jgi:PQQ-dependent catabolism-associated CXXCW motif protein
VTPIIEEAISEKQLKRFILVSLLSICCSLAHSQSNLPLASQPFPAYAFEDKDWGIEPIRKPKTAPFHAPTPTSIPGGRVIKTLELKSLLERDKHAVVIDVLYNRARKSIPGSLMMRGGGDAPFYAAEKSRFSAAMEKVTEGSKARPIVFLCLSSECWLSYNAALYAIEAGYTDVMWYRGGTNAWSGASLESAPPQELSW